MDSYALQAFLQDEPGSQDVEDPIVADDTEVFVSVINLGEVFYILLRKFGEPAAWEFEAKILDTTKIKVMEAPWERVKAAAKIKAMGGALVRGLLWGIFGQGSGGHAGDR
ncbi:MAG: PIN domain-containing protein [Syntrophothermus sp.]